jgi:hypothetical protein
MSNNKQYKFTKIAINKDESKLIEVSVQKFEFEVGGNKKGIEKIVFKGSKDQDIENKDDLVAKLNKDGGLELSFDNEKVEIKEKKTTVTAKVSVASNTVESQDEEEEEQLPLIEVDAEAKTLTIE